MRKIIVSFLIIALLAGGCIKNESGCPAVNETASPAEQQMVLDYLNSNSITALKHHTGFYYSIEQFGSGEFPTICSSVKVTFDGWLTNGTQFENADDQVLNLQLMLPGWRIGLPLIKPGGQIKLYLPPSLAYGYSGKKDESGNQIVPSSSVVIYDIWLTEFY